MGRWWQGGLGRQDRDRREWEDLAHGVFHYVCSSGGPQGKGAGRQRWPWSPFGRLFRYHRLNVILRRRRRSTPPTWDPSERDAQSANSLWLLWVRQTTILPREMSDSRGGKSHLAGETLDSRGLQFHFVNPDIGLARRAMALPTPNGAPSRQDIGVGKLIIPPRSFVRDAAGAKVGLWKPVIAPAG